MASGVFQSNVFRSCTFRSDVLYGAAGVVASLPPPPAPAPARGGYSAGRPAHPPIKVIDLSTAYTFGAAFQLFSAAIVEKPVQVVVLQKLRTQLSGQGSLLLNTTVAERIRTRGGLFAKHRLQKGLAARLRILTPRQMDCSMRVMNPEREELLALKLTMED